MIKFELEKNTYLNYATFEKIVSSLELGDNILIATTRTMKQTTSHQKIVLRGEETLTTKSSYLVIGKDDTQLTNISHNKHRYTLYRSIEVTKSDNVISRYPNEILVNFYLPTTTFIWEVLNTWHEELFESYYSAHSIRYKGGICSASMIILSK